MVRKKEKYKVMTRKNYQEVVFLQTLADHITIEESDRKYTTNPCYGTNW